MCFKVGYEKGRFSELQYFCAIVKCVNLDRNETED